MTGEELYQRMQAALSQAMASVDPSDRHKCTGKIIHDFCEVVRAGAEPSLWREFDDAMYAHGYHRHVVAATQEDAKQ